MRFVKNADGSYCSEDRRVWLTPERTASGTARCYSYKRGAKNWTITIDKLAVATVLAGARDAQSRAAQLFEYYTTKGVPTS